MTNLQKIGLFVGASALWYYVLRGWRALSIRLVGLGFDGLDIQGRSFVLRPIFRIVNPLFVSVFVRNVVGKLYIMDVEVADVNTVVNRPIADNTVTDIPVQVYADMEGLAASVVENIKTGDIRTLMVHFRGTVGVGKDHVVNIPLSIGLTWEQLR